MLGHTPFNTGFRNANALMVGETAVILQSVAKFSRWLGILSHPGGA